MLNKVVFPLLFLVAVAFGMETDLKILIGPGQRECFYQKFQSGKTIEIEYEVLFGGDFDINFWFYSPTNRVLQSEFRKKDSTHTFKSEETGDYQICFDNSMSTFHSKRVSFTVRQLFEQGEQTSTDSWMKNIERDELGDLQNKVQHFKDTFQRIWDQMETAQRYQNMFKNFESLDRSIAEHNFERVNFWSIVHLIVMIFVVIVQVITIRSLFESKSTYGKFLRGKK